jgi:hypothetical protein
MKRKRKKIYEDCKKKLKKFADKSRANNFFQNMPLKSPG